ncbi:MAG: type II restriction endonuclease [Nitrososphaerales archaeon]|nr:type II restriction endonuclease [Nitrososphaerales archaeon]
MTPEEKYSLFASRVSFFEFRDDLPEFKRSDFDYSRIGDAVSGLQRGVPWQTERLTAFLAKNPQGAQAIEGLFQQFRFSDAQLTHFLFDVKEGLNVDDVNRLYDYAISNIQHDPHCQDLVLQEARASSGSLVTLDDLLTNSKRLGREMVVGIFKIVVSKYVSEASKEFGVFSRRMTSTQFGVADRLADYSIRVLKLNDLLGAVNGIKYLENKQIPRDTKGLHGEYAQRRVEQALIAGKFRSLEPSLVKLGIGSLLPKMIDLGRVGLDPQGRYFCAQKMVEGVGELNGKEKRFDFVLVVGGIPKHLFEVNFYATTGTKIGINEQEYVILHDVVKKKTQFEFHWITDGNYWLSPGGKRMFLRLLERFGEVYNLNTFAENLNSFS